MKMLLQRLIMCLLVCTSIPAQAADTPQIQPDGFLRRWDPITVFYPENAPQTLPESVQITPHQEGAWARLGENGWQFRPAEAWPALSVVTVTGFGTEFDQAHVMPVLLDAPSRVTPPDGSTALQRLERVTLEFAAPVAVAELQKSLEIAVSPLPGTVAPSQQEVSHSLKPGQDFSVRQLESPTPLYALDFTPPLGAGLRAGITLKLAAEGEESQILQKLSFETLPPLRALALNCGTVSQPLGLENTDRRDINLACPAGTRRLDLRFSTPLAKNQEVALRDALRFDSSVGAVDIRQSGEMVQITADFPTDRPVFLTLRPNGLRDIANRTWQGQGETRLAMRFAEQLPSLSLPRGNGMVELYGPKMLPYQVSGTRALDVRIHQIDPLDRSLFPFPESPIEVTEEDRPPGPGEEDAVFNQPDRTPYPEEIIAAIRRLPAPQLSKLVTLPPEAAKNLMQGGLELAPLLNEIGHGKSLPGTYLIGIRRSDITAPRHYIRVQVSDLSLTSFEEDGRMRFLVTSLQTAKPIADAEIRVEGNRGDTWQIFYQGKTDAQGQTDFAALGENPSAWQNIQRIIVKKDRDILVLDASRPPDIFRDNLWQQDNENWLGWSVQDLRWRTPRAEPRCTLFPDRPVYRPEDPVHFKGWLRMVENGAIRNTLKAARLVITTPDDQEISRDVTATNYGGVDAVIDETGLPTGEFRARLLVKVKNRDGQDEEVECATSRFRKEAYRLPNFEASIEAPDRVGDDTPIAIRLSTRRYAGGTVSGQAVRWRVTEYPADLPKIGNLPDYVFSDDTRYSDQPDPRPEPERSESGLTNAQGLATLTLPVKQATVTRPRRLVIEATVTDEDAQTVTTTKEILVLPAWRIGVKLPRYLADVAQGAPLSVVAIDANGKLVPGVKLSVALVRRRWSSVLQSGDFTANAPRWVTDRQDETWRRFDVVTTAKPFNQTVALEGMAVYVVTVSGVDAQGRNISVSTDFFADSGGNTGHSQASWPRPPAESFPVSSDRESYVAGDTARLVIQSPFRSAQAMAIIERAEGGNLYLPVQIENAVGRFDVPIARTDVPQMPVHVVLMRGRSAMPAANAVADLTRPVTLAATTILKIDPKDRQINLTLSAPEKAEPGTEISVTLTARDFANRPLAGEATLWLVDQAVLALGREQRLDPLPDFIVTRPIRTGIHDTRNLPFGFLPLAEAAGGGEGADGESLLDNVTPRKDFNPLPFYQAVVPIDKTGKAVVKIKLPDSLTVFRIRAKMAAGEDMFGFAKGTIMVRRPVQVQMALPRFVRPGDRFTLSGFGRMIDGAAGAGRVELRAPGLEITGGYEREIQLSPENAARLDFTASVPATTEPGSQLAVTLGVERDSDKARDAVQINIPVKADIQPVTERFLNHLQADQTLELTAPSSTARAGSLRRNLVLASNPQALKLFAGLEMLREYPYGCSEQILGQTRANIAAIRLGLNDADAVKSREQAQTGLDSATETLRDRLHDNGLLSYWPASKPDIAVTAWAVLMFSEAQQAGLGVDNTLYQKLIQGLQTALRRDDTIGVAESVWVLRALQAAGKADDARMAEMLRRVDFLGDETLAQLGFLLATSKTPETDNLKIISDAMAARLRRVQQDGNDIFAGFQNSTPIAADLLPSDARTLAQFYRSSYELPALQKLQPLLRDGLYRLADSTGWGSTNANAEAILALSLDIPESAKAGSVILGTTERKRTRALETLSAAELGDISQITAKGESLDSLYQMSFLPDISGDRVDARANGLAVSRTQAIYDDSGKNILTRLTADKGAQVLNVLQGSVIEDRISLVNAANRVHIAVTVPLAAGLEILNPALANAPPESRPSQQNSLTPSYIKMGDDAITYFFDSLPAGNVTLAFRSRATTPGSFIQPPARAEAMYASAVNGQSAGVRVVVTGK